MTLTLFVLSCFFLLFCENRFHVFSLDVETLIFVFTTLDDWTFFRNTFYYLHSHSFPTALWFNGFMKDFLLFISFYIINLFVPIVPFL